MFFKKIPIPYCRRAIDIPLLAENVLFVTCTNLHKSFASGSELRVLKIDKRMSKLLRCKNIYTLEKRKLLSLMFFCCICMSKIVHQLYFISTVNTLLSATLHSLFHCILAFTFPSGRD